MKKISKEYSEQKKILRIFKFLAITLGHFVLRSSLHAKEYVNKDALYMHPEKMYWLCRVMAKRWTKDNIEVVVAPAVGGVILSQWVAYHLQKITRKTVLSVYADKDGKEFVLKRGYDKVIKGKRVLVVEDIVTTGGSVKKVVELVRANGGIVVGVSALCNRGKVSSSDVGNPSRFDALLDLEIETWTEKECPACARGLPINTDLGKGAEYLANKKVFNDKST